MDKILPENSSLEKDYKLTGEIRAFINDCLKVPDVMHVVGHCSYDGQTLSFRPLGLIYKQSSIVQYFVFYSTSCQTKMM